MKRVLISLSVLALSASFARADDLYANLYSNTLHITGADGMASTVFINQDGTWEQHLANGTVLKGTYAWKDAQTACFTITNPPPKDPNQAPFCPGNQTVHSVGDSWTMNGNDGKPTTLTITAGR